METSWLGLGLTDLKAPAWDHSCSGSTEVSCLLSSAITHLPAAHCYTDDTQLCLAFQPNDSAAQDLAMKAMEACSQDIRN